MRISTLTAIASFVIAILLTCSNKSAAQQATRDHDIRRDPSIMMPGFKAPQGDAAQTSVITVGDYDNFKLGVDFAECSITVNQLDPKQMYVVWNKIYPVGGTGYYTVNGYDWIRSNPDWTGMMGDVVVVSDNAGRVIFENMFGTGGSNVHGAKAATSHNFGKTWDPVVIALTGIDKNWIAADQTGGIYPNYIYTTMTFNGAGPGVHTVSTNQGASYDSTYTFDTQTLPGMMVAVGPNDSVQGGSTYVVTNSGSSFAATYTFYQSTDGGKTYKLKSAQNFSNYIGSSVSGRHAVLNMRTRPYPFIAADNSYGPHRGRLYLVYASNSPAGDHNKPDVFCRYSDDGGTNWSEARTVNDDTNSVANNNWFPAIWSDKNTGRLYISWMDTRDCPTSDSAMIYATYTDDGITFAPNQQVSNAKMKISCTTCGGGGTPRYQGDYNGIGSTTRGSIMAWTDFRQGTFGSYVGYFPDYALRAFPAIDSAAPVATFYARVPGVKLYTDTVFISASIDADTGLFTISYPEGNKIWQYPGQVPVTVKTNAAPSKNYTLTITTTGSDGTPVHKRTTTLWAYPATVANFEADNTNPCEGNPVNFTDLSTASPGTWAWSFPGGTPDTSSVKNPNGIVYNVAGKYAVSLMVTNKVGSDTAIITDYITVKPTPPTPQASSQAVCFGQTVPPLTATGDSLQWYSSDSLVGTGASFVTGDTAAGVYSYTVTQSANGCESQPAAVSLTIYALPVVNLSKPDSVCISFPAFDLSGGSPSGGSYSGKGVSNGLVFTPSDAGTGTHVLTYTYADAEGCADSSQQTITVLPLPPVTMNPVSPVCLNAGPVKLSALPAGGIFSGPGVSADTLYPSVAGAGSKTITYKYTSPDTGCPGEATQTVVINPVPAIAIHDSTVCGNRKVVYDVTISNPKSYLWTPGGATTPKYQVDTVGKGLGAFTYQVEVTDVNGCATSSSAKVTFYNCTGIDEMAGSNPIELYPNPNQGQFVLRSQSLPGGKYDLTIFDVRGKPVYTEKAIIIENDFLHSLNLGNLSNGVYMVQIRNTNTAGFNKRFVISK